MPNPPDNFFLINLNNVIHLPQMELLLGKSLSGKLDASLNFMQFQTQSDIRRSVFCDLIVYWTELFHVYPTSCWVISASVKISRS